MAKKKQTNEEDARRALLLRRDKAWLTRRRKTALRLKELGYTTEGAAKHMKLTVDDVLELLSEDPCC